MSLKFHRSYPCASCDACFRTNTDLADHVYTEHENNLDMTIPEDVECGEEETCNACPFYEQSIVTDLKNHLKGHDIVNWRCSVCNEKFQTSEELEDHQKRLHDSFEKSFSFLTRNMGDVSQVSSTITEYEIPLLESTSRNVIDDIIEQQEEEVVSVDTIEHQEDEVVINDKIEHWENENSSRKRKLTEEILSVKFIGKLSKNDMISNIISKKRKKCNKW